MIRGAPWDPRFEMRDYFNLRALLAFPTIEVHTTCRFGTEKGKHHDFQRLVGHRRTPCIQPRSSFNGGHPS